MAFMLNLNTSQTEKVTHIYNLIITFYNESLPALNLYIIKVQLTISNTEIISVVWVAYVLFQLKFLCIKFNLN